MPGQRATTDNPDHASIAPCLIGIDHATASNPINHSKGTHTMYRTTPRWALVWMAWLIAPGAQASEPLNFHDASNIVAEYKQWMIGANGSGPVIPHSERDHRSNFNLKGLVPKKFLQYEKQGAGRGINIGWTDTASAATATKSSQWHFSRKSGASGPILYGETIAIGWGNGKEPYIGYSKRKVGINLDWSKRPVYEWTLLGGEPQTPVDSGKDWLVIYNLRHNAPLIYFDRSVGGHIGWPDSQKWGLQTVKAMGNRIVTNEVVKALRWAVGSVPTVEVDIKR